MTRRGAGRGVSQAITHRAQLADGAVQLVGLACEELPVDFRTAVGCEYARDLFQRKSGGAPERDQRQPLHHPGLECAAQTTPSDRRDEPLLLVVTQRRCRHAGGARHLVDVHGGKPLTSSWLEVALCRLRLPKASKWRLAWTTQAAFFSSAPARR